MGPPLKTSPKRIGHAYKCCVTAFGENVLLAESDEVQRVAEAHEAVDFQLPSPEENTAIALDTPQPID
jgi:hypothetical protein